MLCHSFLLFWFTERNLRNGMRWTSWLRTIQPTKITAWWRSTNPTHLTTGGGSGSFLLITLCVYVRKGSFEDDKIYWTVFRTVFLEFLFNNFSGEKENPTFFPCFSSSLPFNLVSACLRDVSICLGLHFLFRHTPPSLHFGLFLILHF